MAHNDQLKRENAEFFEKSEQAFTALFDAARTKNDLYFESVVMPEMRGAQDVGWNTAEETQPCQNRRAIQIK